MGVKQLLNRWGTTKVRFLAQGKMAGEPRTEKSLPLTGRADGEAIGRGENIGTKAPTATGYSRHGWLPRRTAVLQRAQSSNSSVALANVSRLVRPLTGLCCPGGQQRLGSKITKLLTRWRCINIKKNSVQRRADDNRWGLNNVSNLKLTILKLTGTAYLTIALISILTINLINSNYGTTPALAAGLTTTGPATIGISLPGLTKDPNTGKYSVSTMTIPSNNSQGGIATTKHTIEVTTTSIGGYSTTIKADSNGNKLKKTPSDNNASSASTIDPVAGTKTNPTPLADNDSTWGYALPGTTGFSNQTVYDSQDQNTLKTATFAAVPATGSGDTIMQNNQAVTDTNPDTTIIYYGVNVPDLNTMKAGTYTASVTYTATANLPAAPTITKINPNTINVGESKPINIAGTNLESTYEVYIDLNNNSQLDNGEECTTLTIISNNAVSCIVPVADTAGTHDVYVVTQGGTSIASAATKLTYRQVESRTIFDIANMQDMNTDICTNTTTPSSSATISDTAGIYKGNTNYVPEKTLKDIRDNKTYKVRKLADGNCWMAENLALGTSNSAGMKLTNQDTDLHSQTSYTLPAFSSVGTSWSYGDNTPHVIQGSTTAYSSWKAGMGSWYTWGAATADTAKNATSTDVNATDSICPAGWQLPLGGSKSAWGSTTSKSFGNLLRAYGQTSSSSTASAKLQSVPLSFTYAGTYYFHGDVGLVGSDGYYWSSTAFKSSGAYGLHFALPDDDIDWSDDVDPQYNPSHSYGSSVRCVAQ